MKTTILTLIAILAVALIPAVSATAAPFGTDLTLNTTNATQDFELAVAVQPTHLRLRSVLPLSAEGQTVTVTRVHGDWTETLHSFVLGSNVSSGSATLTNAAWLLLGDEVRIAGPTNAILEIQGTR